MLIDNPETASAPKAPTLRAKPWVTALAREFADALRTDSRLEILTAATLSSQSTNGPNGDSSSVPDSRELFVDLLIIENTVDGQVPRVAVYCKTGPTSTRDAATYEATAVEQRRRFPAIRTGLIVRGLPHLPSSLVQLAPSYDFIAAWSAPTELERKALVTVLLDEVQSARALGALISGRKDGKKYAIIHRPIFFPAAR